MNQDFLKLTKINRSMRTVNFNPFQSVSANFNKHYSSVTAVLTVFLVLKFFCVTYAQDAPTTIGPEERLLTIKNPFIPQLPVKPKPPEVPIKLEPKIEPKITQPPVVKPEPVAMPVKMPEPPPKPPQPQQIEQVKPPEIIPVPQITVTGIVWNSDRPQAIINGKIVNQGDTILDIEITEIQKDFIKGQFHGRTITINTQRSRL